MQNLSLTFLSSNYQCLDWVVNRENYLESKIKRVSYPTQAFVNLFFLRNSNFNFDYLFALHFNFIFISHKRHNCYSKKSHICFDNPLSLWNTILDLSLIQLDTSALGSTFENESTTNKTSIKCRIIN